MSSEPVSKRLEEEFVDSIFFFISEDSLLYVRLVSSFKSMTENNHTKKTSGQLL